jgi:hypothetical protein
MSLLAFPTGIAFIFAGYGALSVFGFGEVEPAWGKWGSYQVLVWVGVAAAAFATVPFALSAAVLRRFPSGPLAFALGLSCAVFGIALAHVFPPRSSSFASILVLAGFFLSAGAAPLLARRRNSSRLSSESAGGS